MAMGLRELLGFFMAKSRAPKRTGLISRANTASIDSAKYNLILANAFCSKIKSAFLNKGIELEEKCNNNLFGRRSLLDLRREEQFQIEQYLYGLQEKLDSVFLSLKEADVSDENTQHLCHQLKELLTRYEKIFKSIRKALKEDSISIGTDCFRDQEDANDSKSAILYSPKFNWDIVSQESNTDTLSNHENLGDLVQMCLSHHRSKEDSYKQKIQDIMMESHERFSEVEAEVHSLKSQNSFLKEGITSKTKQLENLKSEFENAWTGLQKRITLVETELKKEDALLGVVSNRLDAFFSTELQYTPTDLGDQQQQAKSIPPVNAPLDTKIEYVLEQWTRTKERAKEMRREVDNLNNTLAGADKILAHLLKPDIRERGEEVESGVEELSLVEKAGAALRAYETVALKARSAKEKYELQIKVAEQKMATEIQQHQKVSARLQEEKTHLISYIGDLAKAYHTVAVNFKSLKAVVCNIPPQIRSIIATGPGKNEENIKGLFDKSITGVGQEKDKTISSGWRSVDKATAKDTSIYGPGKFTEQRSKARQFQSKDDSFFNNNKMDVGGIPLHYSTPIKTGALSGPKNQWSTKGQHQPRQADVDGTRYYSPPSFEAPSPPSVIPLKAPGKKYYNPTTEKSIVKDEMAFEDSIKLGEKPSEHRQFKASDRVASPLSQASKVVKPLNTHHLECDAGAGCCLAYPEIQKIIQLSKFDAKDVERLKEYYANNIKASNDNLTKDLSNASLKSGAQEYQKCKNVVNEILKKHMNNRHSRRTNSASYNNTM